MEFLFEKIIYIHKTFVCHFLDLFPLRQKMLYNNQDSDHNESVYNENNFQNI